MIRVNFRTVVVALFALVVLQVTAYAEDPATWRTDLAALPAATDNVQITGAPETGGDAQVPNGAISSTFPSNSSTLPVLGASAASFLGSNEESQPLGKNPLCRSLPAKYGNFCGWTVESRDTPYAPTLAKYINLFYWRVDSNLRGSNGTGIPKPDYLISGEIDYTTTPLSHETRTCLAHAYYGSFDEPSAPFECTGLSSGKLPLSRAADATAACLERVAQQYSGCAELFDIADRFAAIAKGKQKIWVFDDLKVHGRGVRAKAIYVDSNELLARAVINDPTLHVYHKIGDAYGYTDATLGWLWSPRPVIPAEALLDRYAFVRGRIYRSQGAAVPTEPVESTEEVK